LLTLLLALLLPAAAAAAAAVRGLPDASGVLSPLPPLALPWLLPPPWALPLPLRVRVLLTVLPNCGRCQGEMQHNGGGRTI
jgi:hypothetical protein